MKQEIEKGQIMWIGNIWEVGKIDNGIVAVTAWGFIDNITFPLIFEVYKQND